MYFLQNENVLFYLTYRSHALFGGGGVVLFSFLWGSIFWESVCTQVCVGTHVSEQATIPFSLSHESHRS